MFDKPCETQEIQEEQDVQNVNISILQGSKLFNNYSPFIININSPDTMLKKVM